MISLNGLPNFVSFCPSLYIEQLSYSPAVQFLSLLSFLLHAKLLPKNTFTGREMGYLIPRRNLYSVGNLNPALFNINQTAKFCFIKYRKNSDISIFGSIMILSPAI